MKTWRIITAAATAFALAATIGCNADNSKDQNNNAPEPAVQDEGQAGAGGTNAPADNPSTEDEGAYPAMDREPNRRRARTGAPATSRSTCRRRSIRLNRSRMIRPPVRAAMAEKA